VGGTSATTVIEVEEAAMIAMRHILCPTDFSDGARRALSQAVTLAGWYEARLTVLHVTPSAPTVAGFPPMVNPITMESMSRERVQEEVRAFAEPATAAGLDVKVSVREGPAAAGIVEEAAVARADLIVMGTHGRSGFEHLMLGSVTEKVLRTAPCPVLTVAWPAGEPPPRELSALRHVVCPLDFSESSREALRLALSLAERAKARLTVAHVLEWPEAELRHPHVMSKDYERFVEGEARRQLQAAIPPDARNWCEIREVVLAGTPWRRILHLAAEDAADLIVVGVKGLNAIERLLFGSTANHVVRQASCPVLTVRKRAS
jgi:nucleotide-binding universal stress UspA family protein